ncbi:unnamed protein product [Litomosoides sigmodontis]|uniref:Uncharacterized protein n=1 Tax=Litomosoides sigmodontis TaxID=42156 RepID=A0A3P6TSS5_LITSI|nr:unnamed protein product [Litomosoides sigmodontis]
MVSDPKFYNPKIVHPLTITGFRKMNEDVNRDLSLRQAIGRSKQVTGLEYLSDDVNTTSSSSGPLLEDPVHSPNSTRN